MVFFDRFYREVLGASAATIGEHARPAAAERERGLGAALRRHPPRLRRAPAQGPERLRGAGPRDHRLHGRDRGHARAHRRPIHHPKPQGARLVPGLHGRASRRSTATSRVTSASGSSSSPTRSRPTPRTPGSSRTTLKETLPVATLVFVPPGGGGPLRLRDALLPLERDLRVRDEGPVQEARGDGARSSDAGRRGVSARERRPSPGPGARPTGARERILEAAPRGAEGATATPGLTVAKVAARAGENKALIAYHFGSKQGLVAAAGAHARRADHRAP